MISAKFSKQLKSFVGVPSALIQHLQDLTDAVYSSINRGLSYDANLNSKIVKVSVTSNRAFTLNAKELPVISGAILINTNGAVVQSFKYAVTVRGDLACEIETDLNTTMTFLLIGG